MVTTWREAPWRPADAPLDIDWDRYFAYDALGVLLTLTVRSRGVLVGYILNLVFPHLHYCSTRWAMLDSYWLHPVFRRGWTGVKMFRENEKLLREAGVKVVHFAHGTRRQPRAMQRLVMRLGYEPVEIVYGKVLDVDT